jgi:hypothetical protein
MGMILTGISWLSHIWEDDFPNIHPLINISIALCRPLFKYVCNGIPLAWFNARPSRSLKKPGARACGSFSSSFSNMPYVLAGVVEWFKAVTAVKNLVFLEVVTKSVSDSLRTRSLKIA